MAFNTKDLLQLYTAVDGRIDQHFMSKSKQAPCGKGCASCCSQFFEITDLEFKVIASYLKSCESSLQSTFKERANHLDQSLKAHWPDFYSDYYDGKKDLPESYFSDDRRFDVHMPCVFLGDDGACQVYDARPLVCRTTGVAFTQWWVRGAVCHYIRWGMFTPLWQANLTDLADQMALFRNQAKDHRPMFYFVKNVVTV